MRQRAAMDGDSSGGGAAARKGGEEPEFLDSQGWAVVLGRVVLARVVLARVVLARVVLARVVLARVVLARVVLGRVVLARVVLARVVLARVVLARVVLARVGCMAVARICISLLLLAYALFMVHGVINLVVSPWSQRRNAELRQILDFNTLAAADVASVAASALLLASLWLHGSTRHLLFTSSAALSTALALFWCYTLLQ
ncbi:unnamed protein product [Closterium sp. NIES-65]|nr:unnamed protein product [Closterium sp. NIES-65]